MDPVTIGAVSIIFLLILVLLGVHIGVALTTVSLVAIWIITGNFSIAMSLISNTYYHAVRDYVFAVIPLFIVMGIILSKAELTQDLFGAANVLLRRIKGGLAMATVAANAVFAAVVGSSVASAAAFSKIAMGPMTELGYSKRLALGCIAGSSVLGMLIPPSILFIVYGILTGESIGKLFIAGVVPGIVMATIYCLGIALMIRVKPELIDQTANKGLEEMSWKQWFTELVRPWPVILLIVIVLGGIYGGLFTPTEAAGVGVGGALLVALAKRRLSLKQCREILIESSLTSGAILFLLISAQIYARFIALSGLVQALNSWIIGLGLSQIPIVLIYIVIVFLLGMIIDSTSILLLTIPLILPVCKSLGIDLIWFGVITVISVEIGLITPPFGMSVYTVKASLGDTVALEEIFQGVMPYIIMMLLTIAILITFPILCTWLPGL